MPPTATIDPAPSINRQGTACPDRWRTPATTSVPLTTMQHAASAISGPLFNIMPAALAIHWTVAAL